MATTSRSDEGKLAKNLRSWANNAKDHLVKLLAKKWQACKIYFQNLWVIIPPRWPNQICRQKSPPSLRWCLFHWSLTKRLSTFYERQEHSYKSCFVKKHKHLRFQGTNIWAEVYSCLFRSLESNSVQLIIRKKSHIQCHIKAICMRANFKRAEEKKARAYLFPTETVSR